MFFFSFFKVYLLVTLVIHMDLFWAICSLSNVNKLFSGLKRTLLSSNYVCEIIKHFKENLNSRADVYVK